MKIDHRAREALKEAVEKAGNPTRFAQMIPGIRQTTIRNWLLGISKNISDDNWEKIKPLLKMSGIKNIEIARLLKRWLKIAGVTQVQLAMDQGVTQVVISRQLSGRESIPLERIDKIISLTNPPPDELDLVRSFIASGSIPELQPEIPAEYIGKLELIAQMLRTAVASSVPENMKSVVLTMADSIDEVMALISDKKQNTDFKEGIQ